MAVAVEVVVAQPVVEPVAELVDGHVLFVAAGQVAQPHVALGQVVEADQHGELGAAAPGLLELGLGAAAGEVALGVDQQVAPQVLRQGEGVGAAPRA